MTPLDPDEARARIREELAKDEYDDSPGFIQWLLGAIENWLVELVDGIDGSSAAQGGIAVAIAAALIVVAVLVLRRTGMIRRGATLSVDAALDAEPVLSAVELRRASRWAITEDRTDDATVLALRSLVRDLEDRTLLEVGAGLTSQEAALAAARPFPELRGRLLQGASAFDTAAYSHRTTRPKQAEDLLRLTEYIAESTPDLSGLEPDRDHDGDPVGTGS